MGDKKQNANITAYNKARQRLKRQIKRLENRGYILPENIIPEKPKKITEASVRRLEKITLQKLYEKAEAVQTDTGEIISGVDYRKQERSQSAKKAAKTREQKKYKTDHKTVTEDDITYEEDSFQYDASGTGYTSTSNEYEYIPTSYDLTLLRWLDTLEKNSHGDGYRLLKQWYDDSVSEIGRDKTALLIEQAEYDGVILTWEVCYLGEEAMKYISHMKDLLPKMYDKFEFMSKLEEATISYSEPE